MNEPIEAELPLSSALKDLADRHGVCVRTITREIDAGRLRTFVLRGCKRVLLDDEREWLGILRKGGDRKAPWRVENGRKLGSVSSADVSS